MRRQEGFLVLPVVRVQAAVQPHPALLDPGDAGERLIEATADAIAHGHGHPGRQAVGELERGVVHPIVVVPGERVDPAGRMAEDGPASLAHQGDAGAELDGPIEDQVHFRQDDASAGRPEAVDGLLDGGGRRGLGCAQLDICHETLLTVDVGDRLR